MLPVDVALQPNLLELVPEELRRVAVPRPRRLETFLRQDAERLPQRIRHADRRRVMVHPGNAEVVDHEVLLDHVHVEVPVLDLLAGGRALVHLRERAVAEGQGRDAGGAGQGLLAAGVRGINSPLVEPHGQASNTCDSVRREETVMVARDLAELVHGLAGARRRLRVGHPDHVRFMFGARGVDLFRREDLAPGLF